MRFVTPEKLPAISFLLRFDIENTQSLSKLPLYAAAGAVSPPTTTALPPAFSIFSAADLENLCA